MPRKVNYFEAQRTYVPTETTNLAVVVSALIPSTLSALESRKGASFWSGRTAWAAAYRDITRQQWELLMDATDRIVNEVRALRFGTLTPVEARNPELDPYTVDLPTLASIAFALSDENSSVLDELRAIKDLLQEGGNGDEILGKLDTLILLLGA